MSLYVSDIVSMLSVWSKLSVLCHNFSMTGLTIVEDFTSNKMSEFVSMMTHVNAVEDFTSNKMSAFIGDDICQCC
jgi:hypothetical protein